MLREGSCGCLEGYTCPGCDDFRPPHAGAVNTYDAHDLVCHTLQYNGGYHICPWCHQKVFKRANEDLFWVEIARAYDKHLPHCSKYKLCCVAGVHPAPRGPQWH